MWFFPSFSHAAVEKQVCHVRWADIRLCASCARVAWVDVSVQMCFVLEKKSWYTLPETKIARENRLSTEESSRSIIHFQVRTVSFREGKCGIMDDVCFFFNGWVFLKLTGNWASKIFWLVS